MKNFYLCGSITKPCKVFCGAISPRLGSLYVPKMTYVKLILGGQRRSSFMIVKELRGRTVWSVTIMTGWFRDYLDGKT